MFGILAGWLRLASLNRFLLRTTLVLCCVSSQSIYAVNEEYFENMTLFQMSQLVAEELDCAIIFSPRVRKQNKVGIVLGDPLEGDQLYNVFLGVLNLHGYAAVKTNNVIRIVRERKARTLPSHL